MHKIDIRNKAIEILQNSAAVTSLVPKGNIKNSKVTPFVGDTLPGINVWTSKQNGTSKSMNFFILSQTLSLVVEIYVQSLDCWQDTADKIQEAVEKALFCNQEFLALATEISTYDVETAQYGDGAKPIVSQIMSINMSYADVFKPEEPDATFDELKIEFDVIEPIADPAPGPDGRIEFEVQIKP